jgi:hypothetical protein
LRKKAVPSGGEMLRVGIDSAQISVATDNPSRLLKHNIIREKDRRPMMYTRNYRLIRILIHNFPVKQLAVLNSRGINMLGKGGLGHFHKISVP